MITAVLLSLLHISAHLDVWSYWNRSKLFVFVVEISLSLSLSSELCRLSRYYSFPVLTKKTGDNFRGGYEFSPTVTLKVCGLVRRDSRTAARNRHLLLSIGLKGISQCSTDFPSHGIEFNGHQCVSACLWKTLFKNKEKIILPEFACRFIWKYKVTLYKLPSR